MAAAVVRADDDVARLLHVLLAVEADVSFRALVVRAKCHELERVLAYVDGVGAARARAQQAAQTRRATADAETRSLESSIGDAIRRARRIRLQLASAPNENENNRSDEEDETTVASSSELVGILTQARAIRTTDGPTADRQGTEAKLAQSESMLRQASPQYTRLEYPRRLRTLMERLEEYEVDERTQSFRAVFCRKMTEHLSRRETTTGSGATNDMRVQVGYARQVERLRLAYRRLGDYLDATGDFQSDAVQKALRAPSISSVFPVYCRLKLARALLGQLHDATNGLAQRLPPRPTLSQAAITHRDAMLERLRKKSPTSTEAVATASNHLLVASPSAHALTVHSALLERLQGAWEQELTASSSNTNGGSTPYANVVNETILSEMSTLVLSAFQNAFCDGTSTPAQSTIRDLMGVIRVAESAVLHKARQQRSVVER